MLFLNTALLAGLAAVAIPVLLHLFNRRSAKVVDWAAMQFLIDSIASRRRRIQLEEALLMAVRCLLLALVVLALARPYAPHGAGVPWAVVLPLGLLGLAAAGVSTVFADSPAARGLLRVAALVLLGLCAAAVAYEDELRLGRLAGGNEQDVVFVIDASTSMLRRPETGAPSGGDAGAVNLFAQAVEEAREAAAATPRGSAIGVVVGGPRPESPTGETPTVDLGEVDGTLGRAVAHGGRFAAGEALARAAEILAAGGHVAKRIVLWTDGQGHGWDFDQTGRRERLRAVFEGLPSPPSLILRRLGLPATFRNLAVATVEPAGEMPGAGRRVGIRVTVANTGSEAVTPAAVTLDVSGVVLRDESVGQLPPGAAETVTFFHRFDEPGVAAVTARAVVDDDLPADDRLSRAFLVVGQLGVLVVDGNPSARFFERTSAFAELALSPGGAGAPSLLRAEVVTAAGLSARGEALSPGQTPVVVLADVPRLPAAAAGRLAQFVAGGGGLLVAPGARAEAGFYNGWEQPSGAPLLPARLEARVPAGNPPPGPALTTFGHPAFSAVAEGGQADLATLALTHYWRLAGDTAAPGGRGGAVARLSNGDPFAVLGGAGRGQVALLATSLDDRGSNLASRQAFVPLLHGLVTYLARPAGAEVDPDPAGELVLLLPDLAGPNAPVNTPAGGLEATYTAGGTSVSRRDTTIDFRWVSSPPAPGLSAEGFQVEWTGSLRAPEGGGGDTTFEVDCGGRMDVWIDGRLLLKGRTGGKNRGTIRLEAGRAHDLRVTYRHTGGPARARLFWFRPEEPKTIVPPAALSPGRPGALGSGTGLAAEVEAPGGGRRGAGIELDGTRIRVRVEGIAQPGLYQLNLPPAVRPAFAGLVPPGATTLPFSVGREPAESYLDPLQDEALATLVGIVDRVEAGSAGEVAAILSGEAGGRELWRILAAAAFALVLAETALARWIARSRLSGEDEAVTFEGKYRPGAPFHEQLEKVRGTAARP